MNQKLKQIENFIQNLVILFKIIIHTFAVNQKTADSYTTHCSRKHLQNFEVQSNMEL